MRPCSRVSRADHTTTPLLVYITPVKAAMTSAAGVGVALREAQSPTYKQYQQQTIDNAKTLSSELQQKGYTIISGA